MFSKHGRPWSLYKPVLLIPTFFVSKLDKNDASNLHLSAPSKLVIVPPKENLIYSLTQTYFCQITRIFVCERVCLQLSSL